MPLCLDVPVPCLTSYREENSFRKIRCCLNSPIFILRVTYNREDQGLEEASPMVKLDKFRVPHLFTLSSGNTFQSYYALSEFPKEKKPYDVTVTLGGDSLFLERIEFQYSRYPGTTPVPRDRPYGTIGVLRLLIGKWEHAEVSDWDFRLLWNAIEGVSQGKLKGKVLGEVRSLTLSPRDRQKKLPKRTRKWGEDEHLSASALHGICYFAYQSGMDTHLVQGFQWLFPFRSGSAGDKIRYLYENILPAKPPSPGQNCQRDLNLLLLTEGRISPEEVVNWLKGLQAFFRKH